MRGTMQTSTAPSAASEAWSLIAQLFTSQRTRFLAIVAPVALALPAPAGAANDDATRLARALRADPVHVDRSAPRGLSPVSAGRLRLRIARRDIGRVRIAVVSPAIARRAGGLDALAN